MDPSSASLSPSSNNGTRSHRRNHVLPASPPCTSVLVTSNSCGILPTNSVSFDFSRCVYMEGGVALNSSRERFPGTSFIPWPFAIVGFTIARKILLWWALYVWDSISAIASFIERRYMGRQIGELGFFFAAYGFHRWRTWVKGILKSSN